MIVRPSNVGQFEFVVLATQRAVQLMQGCLPRVNGTHRPTVTAQYEVAAGMVKRLDASATPALQPPAADLPVAVELPAPVGSVT